ncbi:UNVERIFIED_CONTAM: hypothetical protein FKN15_044232 [Acipenser sinensis]
MVFTDPSNLQRHIRSQHVGDYYYLPMVFTDPSNLQRHIRSQHVGARAHTCPDCGKTFATSSGLKQHKHIHSSVKPFICEVCHKSYTQFSNLCRHKRMHADCRTQIKCKDCGQMFSTTSSLNKHRRFCEGKNHYNPGGMFNSGLPMTSSPLMGKSKPQHSLNHLGFSDYFPSRSHHPGLPFSPTPPAFHTLPPGFPGIFPPSLYPRPPLLPPSPLLKSPLNHSQEDKRPRSPLSVVSPVNNNGSSSYNNFLEAKAKTKLEMRSAEKCKVKISDLSDGSDLEDVNTTSGTDLDTTTGTVSGSDLDSDAESDRDKSRRKVLLGTKQDEVSSSSISISSSGNVPSERPFLSQHSFFPPPDEQALPASGATNDSIKAIASIAEKYFGPGFMGVQEKKMSSLPYHSMFPFQFLPNFPHSLYPFTDRALNPGMFLKDEPRSPREHLQKVGCQGSESPFDLTTKPKEVKQPLPPSKPALPASAPLLPGEEQPLDLSIGTRRRAAHNGSATESRKNHVYGSRRGPPKEDQLKHPHPQSQSLHHHHHHHQQQQQHQHHQQVHQQQQQPSLHYAKPSPFFMDPIYSRVEKRKLMDPVGALKEKYLRPSPLLFHPQVLWEDISQVSKSYPALKDTHRRAALQNPSILSADSNAPGLLNGRCKYCDRSFSISSNLQRHVRNIHNKEKPFKCHLCNRCFGQQTNLDRHLKKHEHENIPVSHTTLPVTLSPPHAVIRTRSVSHNTARYTLSTPRCDPDRQNLDRHLKKHEHENIPVSQHSGILSNLGTSISSPSSEPDNHALLDEKEDSYFSEIRNFIANSELNQASSSTDKRCIDEDEAGLLELEQIPTFGKGLDLRKAAEEPFEVKDMFNSSLESETLKETLYRQAKTQAYAMMLSLSENNSLHMSSQNSLDAWLVGGGASEPGNFHPLNHI